MHRDDSLLIYRAALLRVVAVPTACCRYSTGKSARTARGEGNSVFNIDASNFASVQYTRASRAEYSKRSSGAIFEYECYPVYESRLLRSVLSFLSSISSFSLCLFSFLLSSLYSPLSRRHAACEKEDCYDTKSRAAESLWKFSRRQHGGTVLPLCIRCWKNSAILRPTARFQVDRLTDDLTWNRLIDMWLPGGLLTFLITLRGKMLRRAESCLFGGC